jgi:hypothetical protein
MSQYVVWFDSSETGAPVLNNGAGAALGVIKACLISGFNTKTITSLVVAGGVATATCAAHGYSNIYGKDLEIAGALPAALNGRKALTFTDTNTFKFDATGVADGTATGTITAKRAPAGWTEVFTGTNKSLFKSLDVTAPGQMLYLDDTKLAPATNTDMRATMVESATDINTLTGLAPTATQLSGGQYWNKGSNDTTAKQWCLIATGKAFYFVTPNSAAVLPVAVGAIASASLMGFGAFETLKAGDAYNTFICGAPNSGSGNSILTAIGNPFNFSAGGVVSLVVSRPHTQIGSAVLANTVGIGSTISGSSGPTGASPIDNGVFIYPRMMIAESNPAAGNPARGFVPGMCQVLAQFPFQHYQIIDTVASLPGRKVMAINHGNNGSGGMLCVDLTGPW